MSFRICAACGTEFATASPPETCDVCDDFRQYVPPSGQRWTTMAGISAMHRNAFVLHEPGIYGIGTEPRFAIGQRAILIQTRGGNVLWDCVSLLDPATVAIIEALGGVAAIAISHPHFYTTNRAWSQAFNAPVHLHAADRDWVRSRHDGITFWDGGTLALMDGVTLVRTGGHFPGATVLHHSGTRGGPSQLFTGDTFTVTPDRKWLSFMRSYPNLVPCAPSDVLEIARVMAPYRFDNVYGHYFDRVIVGDGRAVFDRSIERYLSSIGASNDRGSSIERGFSAGGPSA